MAVRQISGSSLAMIVFGCVRHEMVVRFMPTEDYRIASIEDDTATIPPGGKANGRSPT